MLNRRSSADCIPGLMLAQSSRLAIYEAPPCISTNMGTNSSRVPFCFREDAMSLFYYRLYRLRTSKKHIPPHATCCTRRTIGMTRASRLGGSYAHDKKGLRSLLALRYNCHMYSELHPETRASHPTTKKSLLAEIWGHLHSSFLTAFAETIGNVAHRFQADPYSKVMPG